MQVAREIVAIERKTLGDQEQTEFLSRLQLGRIVQIAEQDLRACRDRAAAGAEYGEVRIGLGLLDLGKNDLGIDHLAVRADQEDAEGVHEGRELAAEYDRCVATLAQQ